MATSSTALADAPDYSIRLNPAEVDKTGALQTQQQAFTHAVSLIQESDATSTLILIEHSRTLFFQSERPGNDSWTQRVYIQNFEVFMTALQQEKQCPLLAMEKKTGFSADSGIQSITKIYSLTQPISLYNPLALDRSLNPFKGEYDLAKMYIKQDDPTRHISYTYEVDQDEIFQALFRRLARKRKLQVDFWGRRAVVHYRLSARSNTFKTVEVPNINALNAYLVTSASESQEILTVSDKQAPQTRYKTRQYRLPKKTPSSRLMPTPQALGAIAEEGV